MTAELLQNWVVQTGLMISVLIVIILLIRRPFTRMFGANAAYALWSLPLIRLCLPGLSLPQNWMPEFLRQAFVQRAAPSSTDMFVSTGTAQSGGVDVSIANVAGSPEAVQWSVIFIGIWLSVAVLWLAFQIVQQRRFKTNLTANSYVPDSDTAIEIAQAIETVRLRKPPSVRIAADGTGPLVTGVLIPLVILPDNFSETYDAQQRHFALVHEFAHIKRRDLWVALTTLIFRAVNWPNPLVHYAANKLRGDQEAACDAYVMKVTGGETAHSYAETLVKAVRQADKSSIQTTSLALSLAQTDTEISKGD